MNRREYEINNCFSYLANRVSVQEMEIKNLRQEFCDQKDHFDGIVNSLQEAIKKLNDDVSHQLRDITVPSDKINNSFRSVEWQLSDNVKMDEKYVLTVDEPSIFGFVQLAYALVPTKPSFKIYLLDSDNWSSQLIWIGLTPNGHPITLTAKVGSIIYRAIGSVDVVGENINTTPKWKVGDIIECGIKFPTNFINDGEHSASVYFSNNERIIFEKPFTIPKDGLFPTIRLFGRDCRLRFFQK